MDLLREYTRDHSEPAFAGPAAAHQSGLFRRPALHRQYRGRPGRDAGGLHHSGPQSRQPARTNRGDDVPVPGGEIGGLDSPIQAFLTFPQRLLGPGSGGTPA